MDMPKPSERHEKLKLLVGSWVGDEHMHPSPWDARGGRAIGHVHNRPALDGFAVIQDYEQERDGNITFRGHGVFTWDLSERCYILYWFDSLGFPPNIFKGTFDNTALTLTSQSVQGYTRAVWDFGMGGKYAYRMEFSPDGKQWSTFVDGTYDKKGS